MLSILKRIFKNKIKEQEILSIKKEQELNNLEKEIKTKSNNNTTPIHKTKKTFSDEEKKEYAKRMKEMKEKGKAFEKFIGEHFEKQGYTIRQNGIEKGKKDKGIDIVCTKENDLILIQCKNWKKNSKYKIRHKDLKEFVGNCTIFVNDNNLLGQNLKLKFITSNPVLDKSAEKFLEENKILKYEVLEFN